MGVRVFKGDSYLERMCLSYSDNRADVLAGDS